MSSPTWDEIQADFYLEFMKAMLARVKGNDKLALEHLDGAIRYFSGIGKDGQIPKMKRARGRPKGAKNKRPDRDAWTITYMNWLSKEFGVSNAEPLAEEAYIFHKDLKIHVGASKTAFIKRVSEKFRRQRRK